jgi:hypothetical protein
MALNLKIFNFKHPQEAANPTPSTGLALTRHFVLTGDERCPIAGIWSHLSTGPNAHNPQPSQSDDPSLPQPATETPLWRPIHLFFTTFHYLPA